jgi:hypothetical protein
MEGMRIYLEYTRVLGAVSFSTKNCHLETSPGLRVNLLTGLLILGGQWHICVHRRLQWRDRRGITPRSVFPDPAELILEEAGWVVKGGGES